MKLRRKCPLPIDSNRCLVHWLTCLLFLFLSCYTCQTSQHCMCQSLPHTFFTVLQCEVRDLSPLPITLLFCSMAPKVSKLNPIAKSKAKGGNGLVVAKWNNKERQSKKTEWKRFSQNLEKASSEALLDLCCAMILHQICECPACRFSLACS